MRTINQIEHSVECVRLHVEQALFLMRWPNVCPICWGVGSWSSYSRTDGPDGGPCPGEWITDGYNNDDTARTAYLRPIRRLERPCVEQGYCPRCCSNNTQLVGTTFYDYLWCHNCGWDERIVSLGLTNIATDLVAPFAWTEGQCDCKWQLAQNHEFEIEYDIKPKADTICNACGTSYQNHGG